MPALCWENRSVQDDAERFGATTSYIEPFAVRAQAIVSDDDALLARAQELFSALGSSGTQPQTPTLIELRKRAH